MPTFGGLLSPYESGIGIAFFAWALLGLIHPGALGFAKPEKRLRRHAVIFPLAIGILYFLCLLSFAGEKWLLWCVSILGLLIILGYGEDLRGHRHRFA